MISNAASGRQVLVVGAGIVGVCAAYALRRRGWPVTLIERGEPGRGASYGNSGALSPGSVAPLAMPGALASVPGMLIDPRGPLYLPPSYLPRALPWLLRFVAAAQPARVRRIAAALADLHRGAIERHLALAAEVGAADLIVRHGHLHLYPDENAIAADQAAWALRSQHGIAFERVDRERIVDLEPRIKPRYQAGIFMRDQATVVNPYRYLSTILHAFLQGGGRLVSDEVRGLRRHPDGNWACEGRNGVHYGSDVVVAAGAWSLELLASIGVRAALETQRGYHVSFRTEQPLISRTVVLADRKIFMAPMQDGLRAGGTVEFGGLQRAPDYARADVLGEFARDSLEGLDGVEYASWMGHRPCMPDTLPRVGPVDGHDGIWLAFGHGHLGLTDSANSAHLLAELMAGRP